MSGWPLQLLVIALPGGAPTPGLLDQVRASRTAGVIQLVDAGIVRKGDDGELTLRPAPDLLPAPDPRAGTIAGLLFGCAADPGALDWIDDVARDHALEPQLFGLSADDLAEIVDGIPRASDALVLLVEHRWTAGFAESVTVEHGALLAEGSIVPRTITEVCGRD